MIGSAPVVTLERVRAHDSAGPGGRPRGRLFGLDAALNSGVHAILGAPDDGTLALAEVLSGRVAPLAGRALVAGRDPARSAAIRARVGVLAPAPELPDAGRLAESLGVALRARGEAPGRAAAVLAALGLSPLLGRRFASLSFAETRAVELALALTTPAPLMVCLYEPFGDVAVPVPTLVGPRLRELAASGVCVVLITSSPGDARSLSDRIHLLDRGVIARSEPGDGDRLATPPGRPGVPAPPGVEAELVALVQEPTTARGPGVRALAAAVSRSPSVRALAWEEAASGAVSTLRVRSSDRDAAALALLDAAAEEDIALVGISSQAPSLQRVRAATAVHVAALRPPSRPFGAPSPPRVDAVRPPMAADPGAAAAFVPASPPEGLEGLPPDASPGVLAGGADDAASTPESAAASKNAGAAARADSGEGTS